MDIHEAMKRYPHYTCARVTAVATPDGLLLRLHHHPDGIESRLLTCREDFGFLQSALNTAEVGQSDRQPVYDLFNKAVAERVAIDQDRNQAWRIAGELRTALTAALGLISRLSTGKNGDVAACPWCGSTPEHSWRCGACCGGSTAGVDMVPDGMRPIDSDSPFYYGTYLVWRPGMTAPIKADHSNKGWRDSGSLPLGTFTHWRREDDLYITSWTALNRSWIARGKVLGYDFHAVAGGGEWRLTVHARAESSSAVVCALAAGHSSAETFDRQRAADLLAGAVPAISAALAAQRRRVGL